jgi:hypothetical protein
MHHSHSMHLLSSVHFSYRTPPPSSHIHYSLHQQQLISSFLNIIMLPMHLVHPLYLMVLHPLHVECSTCSSWQLFTFFVCSCLLSIITGCHNQIPLPHHQLRFFIFCYSQDQLFCCSYRLQRSSSCQSPSRIVFCPTSRSLETLHLLCQSRRSVFESTSRNHQWFLVVTL